MTWKKSPNVYKSCPKIISVEKLKILTPFQKLPMNVGDMDKINCCQRLQKLAQSPINRPIWSHCKLGSIFCQINPRKLRKRWNFAKYGHTAFNESFAFCLWNKCPVKASESKTTLVSFLTADETICDSSILHSGQSSHFWHQT